MSDDFGPQHPCYVGDGEYDHDMQHIDESFSHEYGTEVCGYFECQWCGLVVDDREPPYEDWTDWL